MRLRPAAAADVPALAAIHRLAAYMPPLEGVDSVEQALRDRLADGSIWVSEAGGEPAGYVAFDEGWLHHLFVHPDHQGRGHGEALLTQAMADGRERQLWTFAANMRARAFYEARGWALAETTDGQSNDHKAPEVRYVRRTAEPR